MLHRQLIVIDNLAVCNFVQGMIALFYAHPVDAVKIAGKIYPESLTKRTPLRNVLQPEANSFTVHLFMIVRTVLLFHRQPVGKDNLQLVMETLQFTTISQKGAALIRIGCPGDQDIKIFFTHKSGGMAQHFPPPDFP